MAILEVLVLPGACSEGIAGTDTTAGTEEVAVDFKSGTVPATCILTGNIADAPIPGCIITGTVNDNLNFSNNLKQEL